MTESLSLIADGATAFEIELLLAGRRDALTPSSQAQILTELGVGVGAAAGTIATTAVPSGIKLAGSTAKSIWPLAGIGIGVGVSTIAAIAVWVGAGTSTPEAPQAASPKPAAVVVEHEVAQPKPAPPAVAEVTDVEQLEPEAPPKAVPAPRPARDPLAAELAAIDQARQALARGDQAHALRLLDDHARRFRKPRLAAEATVLRIEALVQKGDMSAATRLGNSFLARQPNGPYGRRVRSLIRQSESSKTP